MEHDIDASRDGKQSAEGLNYFGFAPGYYGLASIDVAEWVEVEMTADTGACETVMNGSRCPNVETEPSPGSEAGVEYEAVNGKTIPNQGQKRCLVMTNGSEAPKRMDIQIADVQKPLLSISRVAELGYDCVFKKGGGCLQDVWSGGKIPIQRKGKLYVLKIWVKSAKSAGFARQER